MNVLYLIMWCHVVSCSVFVWRWVEALRLYPEPPLLIRRALEEDLLPQGSSGVEGACVRAYVWVLCYRRGSAHDHGVVMYLMPYGHTTRVPAYTVPYCTVVYCAYIPIHLDIRMHTHDG